MGRIKDTVRYNYDSNVTGGDYIIGTDADDLLITKSFKVDDVATYLGTVISGTTQDNVFVEIDLGTIEEGDSLAALANALPEYTITESSLAIYKTITNPTTEGGELKTNYYVSLLKGKGTYGVGGTPLVAGNFLNINPFSPDITRNTTIINNIISTDKIYSGDAVWTGTGLVYESTPLEYSIAGAMYSSVAYPSITLDVGDANPRKDIIIADTSGVVSIIKGTAAPSPSEPLLTDPNTQIKVTVVDIAALATTPTGVTEELVYDEDAGEPTEWTITENTGAARIVSNSTDFPYGAGTKSIKGITLVTGDKFIATDALDFPVTVTDYLNFKIKLIDSWELDSSLKIRFYKDASVVSQDVVLSSTGFGFDRNDISGYQAVVIPFSHFAVTTTDIDQIEFEFVNPSSTDVNYVDNIQIIKGVTPPTGLVIPTLTSELTNDGEDGINPFITLLDIPAPLGNTLQEVLDAGDNAASVDTFSTFNVNLADAGAGDINAILSNGAAKLAKVTLDFGKALLGGTNLTQAGEFNVTLGIPKIIQSDVTGAFTSTIGFWAPTATSIQNFAHPGAGTYTIPLTVNGVTADTTGEITVQAGAIEAIDETNGIGLIISGRDATIYGNVGLRAIDFSISDGTLLASSTRGATGEASVCFGEDNIHSGYGAFGNGFLNNLTGTYSTGFGHDVNIAGYSSFGAGAFLFETSATGYNLLFGQGNHSALNAGFTAGAALLKGAGVGCTVLGAANVDIISSNNGTDVNAPMIIIGNGTHATDSLVEWTALVRSNLFVGYRNGEVVVPSSTIAVINAEATGKQLVTKEWVLANGKTVTTDITTTHTIAPADSNIIRVFTDAGAITVTVDTDSLTTVGDIAEIDQWGTGDLTITAGTATLYQSALRYLIADGQYSRVSVQKMSATEYRVFGELEVV